MTRLRRLFDGVRAEGRAALIPYLTAGDPDLERTLVFAQTLADAGADAIELGVPFSDPLADGPVIQRAVARSLAAGTRLSDVLRLADRIRERTGIPVVLMTYVNPPLQYGWDKFVSDAAGAGVAGLILTDVPAEEADRFLPALREADIGTVFLVAPTSGEDRIRRAAEISTGFLYCVTRLGITGVGGAVAGAFRPVVQIVRGVSDVPVGLGFGISTPEHAAEAAEVADAVIVGSALVELVEGAASPEDAVARLAERARALRAALGRAGPA